MTNAEQLLAAFNGAILPSGKINPQWRKKFAAQGEAVLAAVPDAKSLKEAIFRLKTGIARPVCKTCGRYITFNVATGIYNRFCSVSCGQNDPDVQQTRVKTNLERYGVPNAGGFGTQQHKAGMFLKHGVEHPMSSTTIKNKLKETNLKRYGVECVFAAETIKKEIEQTVVERYSVQHVMQIPAVKDKFRTKDGKWKPAVTNVELRKQNTLQTIIKKIKHRLETSNFELLSEPTGFSYAHRHTVIHHVCGSIFEAVLYSGVVPRCFTCEPLLNGTSKLQQKVEDFIQSLGIKIEVGNRSILDRKEIDIYLPSFRLGFEINGLYTHSVLAGFSPTYHLEKTEKAASKEVRLVHLFEDDITHRWDVVQSMIRSLLNLNARTYARHCIVQEVKKPIAIAFCNENHLKKSARFNSAIGLYDINEQLLACALFGKPRYTKKHQHELIRFCTKQNLNVVGGFSKLITYFERQNEGSLISYADRSYSIGNVYYRAGFILERILPPNYWYFQNNVNIREHPTQLRKYKLQKLYNDIDLNKTEWELLQERGWNKIWDCGQLVFTKELRNKQ